MVERHAKNDASFNKKEPNTDGISEKELSNDNTPTAVKGIDSLYPTLQAILKNVNDLYDLPYVDKEGIPNYGVYTKDGVMFLKPGDLSLS